MSHKRTFGLYVHVPFCLRKCPYCDFASLEVVSEGLASLEEAYARALLLDFTRSMRGDFGSCWRAAICTSIYFGGGTPSVLSLNFFERVLDAFSRELSFGDELELTVEVNPGALFGASRGGGEVLRALRSLRALGVNRLSVGVQSFCDRKLKLLGRMHSASVARDLLAQILKADFSNFNIDLIFGVRGDNQESWARDLQVALSYTPPHISAYALTIAEGGPRELCLGDSQLCAFLYAQIPNSIGDLERYEISNYALQGFRSLHNLGYWRRLDYLGLGPSAATFLRREGKARHGHRRCNLRDFRDYFDALMAGRNPLDYGEFLDEAQEELEFIFLSLRICDGLDCDSYRESFGRDFKLSYGELLLELSRAALLEEKGQRIVLSERGLLLSDEICSRFSEELTVGSF